MSSSADACSAAAELAQLVVRPCGVTQQAQRALDVLEPITHFDAAFLVLLDPERRLARPLARRGYPAEVQRFFDSSDMVDDLERAGMHRTRTPIQLADIPVPPQELATWGDYLYPAGFRQCLGVPLTTADGRYIGQFGANSGTATPLPADTITLLTRLAPLLALAFDPLRPLAALAQVTAGAGAGVIVTRAGSTETLPGLPGDRLLGAGSPVLEAACARLASGPVRAQFLVPCDDNVDANLLRVTALACPSRPPGNHLAVVLLSPPPPDQVLTRRELAVLGLLVDGHGDAAIAACLALRPLAVATHVEQAMVKLGADSRAMAAVRAERQGLYLPATLIRRLERQR